MRPACSSWWRSWRASSACTWRTPKSCRRISIRSAPSWRTSRASARSRRPEATQEMRVEQFLRDSARRCGDKVALVAGGARVTYGELDRASDRLAGALAQGGMGKQFTAADWIRAIRHGVGPDGKSLIIMPATSFYHFSDADLGAVIA